MNTDSKRLASGMQVLITNPSLVETGLDLNAFTTLIFFSMGYKLFTLRQASRRSWRINQTAPKVGVYMLYYRDAMQQKVMKLMASKLAVAGIIEGNFTEEGLAAMSDAKDMTSQMAKELMMGIKDNVEDIAASFKKMAIVNPGRKEQAEANALPAPEVSENPSSELVEILKSEIDASLAEMELTPETVSGMTPCPLKRLPHWKRFLWKRKMSPSLKRWRRIFRRRRKLSRLNPPRRKPSSPKPLRRKSARRKIQRPGTPRKSRSFNGGNLNAVSTDGQRIASAKGESKNPATVNLLVSTSALARLAQLVTNKDEVQVGITGRPWPLKLEVATNGVLKEAV